ncbi:MAG: hypothetical protein GC165_06725 [Armatimonadetes bacterium]|nr:hypothetical protein [Armatimonadota bacterium]
MRQKSSGTTADQAPARRVEYPAAKLKKPIIWTCAIVAGLVFWGFSVGRTPLWIPFVASACFLGYAYFRTRCDLSEGWYMEERNGEIAWYAGWKEQSIPIRMVVNIDAICYAHMMNGDTVALPDDMETFLPVYLHLYHEHPRLFRSQPSKSWGRSNVI